MINIFIFLFRYIVFPELILHLLSSVCWLTTSRKDICMLGEMTWRTFPPNPCVKPVWQFGFCHTPRESHPQIDEKVCFPNVIMVLMRKMTFVQYFISLSNISGSFFFLNLSRFLSAILFETCIIQQFYEYSFQAIYEWTFLVLDGFVLNTHRKSSSIIITCSLNLWIIIIYHCTYFI